MKAVIFDVDGTLVNSVDLHAKALQETFHHFGHPCPFDQIRSQIGKDMDQILPVFFLEEELSEKVKECWGLRHFWWSGLRGRVLSRFAASVEV